MLNDKNNRALGTWSARFGAGLFAVVAMLGGAGCERYHDVDAFMLPPHPVVAGTPYRVAPPDVLSVQSQQASEINSHFVRVSPTGTIHLALVGEVAAAGRSVEEIGEEIRRRASEFYQEVDVVVRVAEYRSQHVYVFGEVGQPGRYEYNGSDTVLDVLARAQPTRLADPNRIQVLRPGPDGQSADRMTVELKKWIEKGELDRAALLADGDIVYVPPNGLARAGLLFQQVLLPIQPAAATMRGPAEIGADTARISGQRN